MRQTAYYNGEARGIFDTHAHLYDSRFDQEGMRIGDILLRAAECGIERILIPSDSIETSGKAIDLVREYDGISGVELFCSVGVHPHEAKDWDDNAEKKIREWLSSRKELKIAALGEIGLDYHYDYSPRDIQREVYEKQLMLAYEYDIPIILHEREAAGDSTDILRKFCKEGRLRSNPGVCHCCSASREIGEELVKMGFYIGFDGPVTFRNNKKTIELCEATPLERIVIETDSPYLTPEPNRGIINEPAHVAYVAEKIAEIKGVSVQELAEITAGNGMRLYELGEAK
ncbi:MAG: TatD family hydrolase [Clostridiales bacterium]|nr:TatD family hydrolase [Clostridiales bacterium]